MPHNQKTLKMLEHFKKEWATDVIIVVPQGTKPQKEWDSIHNGVVNVVFQREHEHSTEWEIIVHKVFRFGVVLNQHGYQIQQLKYQP